MFSFRTYLRPLKVLEKRTEVMQRLLAAFMALPEEVVSAAALKDRSAFEPVVHIDYLGHDCLGRDAQSGFVLCCNVLCCSKVMQRLLAG